MQIQINTDHHIEGGDRLDGWASGAVETALQRYADSITRVEVHFNLENAGRAGSGDKRCAIEARMNGRPPVTVTHHAEALDGAFNGALHKLQRALEHAQGRADKHAHDPRAMPVTDTTDDDFVPSSAPF